MKKENRNQTIINETNTLKLEFVKWGLSLFCSAIIITIILKLINVFYNPDIQASLDLAKKLLVIPETVLPEPKEKMMFIATLFSGTISLFLFYYFFTIFYRNRSSASIESLYLLITILGAGCLLIVLYKGLNSANPFANTPQNSHDFIAKKNVDFYFIKSFIYEHFYVFLFVLFPIIFLWLINYFKIDSKLGNKIIDYISIGLVICIILIVCAISTFNFPYTFENKYDFNTVYYSVVQVYNGFPMLVDNFTNTYGLYPHFIVPILKVTGLSIFNFTLIMGMLLSLCFSLIYYFLTKSIPNKLIVFFGFTSVFYNSYMYSRIVTNYDSYFAIHPIRWLFPCLLLAYSVIYFSKTSKINNINILQRHIPFLHQFNITVIKLLSFLFFSVGILWAPDTGTFTFLALLAFYSFQEINLTQTKATVIKIAMHILIALLILMIVTSFFILIIKMSYGVYPDILSMFSTIKSFSVLGLGMLPMSNTWHLWMIVAIVYFIGLLYSIAAIVNQKINEKSSIIFLLSVMGILFFSYYQGRSHNWSLLIINFPVFILLTIFCSELLELVKKYNLFIIPFAIVLFFISFSVFQVIYDNDKILALVKSKHDKKINLAEQQKIIATAKIINDLTLDKEKIFILSATQYQSLYHSLSNTSSAINPGFTELVTNKDYDAILTHLEKDNIKVFFEPQLFRFSSSKIQALLSSIYDVKKEFIFNNSLLWYLTKKEEQKNEKPLLDDGDNIVLHELLNTNFSNKLKYSLGKFKAVKLDTAFSIEIIFKPRLLIKNQYTESATLISNVDGANGFSLLQNHDNPNQYLFSISNQGIICPVTPGNWNYLAIEINQDKIKCYANGVLVGNVNTKTKYQNSEVPIYIGNYNNMCCFFFGDIYELKIKNKLLDEANVKLNSIKIFKTLF